MPIISRQKPKPERSGYGQKAWLARYPRSTTSGGANLMAAVTKRKRRLQRYTSAEFKPYVVALGQLALAWNDLQESLAALFWTLANPPPQPGDRVNYIPLRIWASIKSDRIQREILRTVINHSQTNWGRDRMTKDLIWLIDKANSLEDSRNDAVHSPLFSVDKSLYETGPEKIAPARRLFNPRASKLSERSNLLKEFRYCRDAAIKLADYAQLIDRALVNPGRTWPDKPSLPIRPPRKAPQDRPRQPPPI
jgi:hypothetical protein